MCLGAAGEIFALCKKVALDDLHVEHFSDAHVKMRQNYHLESAFILPLPCQAVACILIEHFSVHFFFSENKQCSSTCWFYNAEYEWNYANEQKDTRRKKTVKETRSWDYLYGDAFREHLPTMRQTLCSISSSKETKCGKPAPEWKSTLTEKEFAVKPWALILQSSRAALIETKHCFWPIWFPFGAVE